MFIVDENGDITLRQGDDGKLGLDGLPDDKEYVAYLAIQDKKRRKVGSEISVNVSSSHIDFVFTPALTDLLTVPAKQDTEEYYYYVKICYQADGIEDTLILGNKGIEDMNVITVYPKGVEGTIDG